MARAVKPASVRNVAAENTREFALTKKQKKQKPVANHGNQPVASNNLSLREAARKLQKLRPAETISNTTAYDLLLKELRAGALYAGFYAANAWIEIPPDHWAYVTTTQ